MVNCEFRVLKSKSFKLYRTDAQSVCQNPTTEPGISGPAILLTRHLGPLLWNISPEVAWLSDSLWFSGSPLEEGGRSESKVRQHSASCAEMEGERASCERAWSGEEGFRRTRNNHVWSGIDTISSAEPQTPASVMTPVPHWGESCCVSSVVRRVWTTLTRLIRDGGRASGEQRQASRCWGEAAGGCFVPSALRFGISFQGTRDQLMIAARV